MRRFAFLVNLFFTTPSRPRRPLQPANYLISLTFSSGRRTIAKLLIRWQGFSPQRRLDSAAFVNRGIRRDIGLSILEISEAHRLSNEQDKQLRKLSESDDAPPDLTALFRAGLAIVAASLIGLGIIFWIAANWESLSRAGRFIMLHAVVAVMCLGAYARPRARVPLGLLALLAIGAVFAYFGQTYQTGADPWQLFALWALLGLPLACPCGTTRCGLPGR